MSLTSGAIRSIYPKGSVSDVGVVQVSDLHVGKDPQLHCPQVLGANASCCLALAFHGPIADY